MRLNHLLRSVQDTVIIQKGNPIINGISIDSRSISPGDLFIALRGGQLSDRHPFVNDAANSGAVAAIVEEPVEAGDMALVQVTSTRKAIGIISDVFYKSPSKHLKTVAVTGTNGKTTTSTLIHAILSGAGHKSGLIGTINHLIGQQLVPSFQTTPEANEVQRLLRVMLNSNCQAVVLEASSHGLALHRLNPITFDLAVFTNLTRDHLDFHKTFKDYKAAKTSLFEGLDPNAKAIINIDDPFSSFIMTKTEAEIITYGRSKDADFHISEGETDWSGTRITVKTTKRKFEFQSALCGNYHQLNLLAAIVAGFALGIDSDTIREAIRDVKIPGRYEPISYKQDFAVIVDYAHTPDAIEKVLESAREFSKPNGKLFIVFGCDGDRDHGKRPIMGKIATHLADWTIFTTSHPGSEDPQLIIDDILKGVKPKASYIVELDRFNAIKTAIHAANKGDVVVIAGKGHEPYQIIGTEKVPFDDREVALNLLKSYNHH